MTCFYIFTDYRIFIQVYGRAIEKTITPDHIDLSNIRSFPNLSF